MRERKVEIAFPILDLAVKHRLGDRKLIEAKHVVQPARFRHPVARREKQRL